MTTHPEPPHDTVHDDVDKDWDLVTATKNGNHHAFGLLYTKHVDTVFRYVLYRTRDRALAEDLTADTFLRALTVIHRITDTGHKFRALIMTIARNLVLDHVKSAHYRTTTPTADQWDVGILHQRPEHDPASVVAGHDALRRSRDILHNKIRSLTVDQQECLNLRFYAGLSTTDTAHVMGRDVSAVKALQHRAIRRLAATLPDDAFQHLCHA